MSPVPHGCRWHASTSNTPVRCLCRAACASLALRHILHPSPSRGLELMLDVSRPSVAPSLQRVLPHFGSRRSGCLPLCVPKCALAAASQVSMTSGVPDAVSCRVTPHALPGCCIVVHPVPSLATFSSVAWRTGPRHICNVLARVVGHQSANPWSRARFYKYIVTR